MTGPVAPGTGRVVFGSRRLRLLDRARRIALYGAEPPAPQAPDPHEAVGLRDWLPPLLLLVANLVLALAASVDLIVAGAVATVAIGYSALVWWAPEPTGQPGVAATSPGGQVSVRPAGRVAASGRVTGPSAPLPTGAADPTLTRKPEPGGGLSWIGGTIGKPDEEGSPPRQRRRPHG